jgi:hypothetical protein
MDETEHNAAHACYALTQNTLSLRKLSVSTNRPGLSDANNKCYYKPMFWWAGKKVLQRNINIQKEK